jgi:hypothetical protein
MGVAALISAPPSNGKRPQASGKRRQAIRRHAPAHPRPQLTAWNYNNFTNMNPPCNGHPGCVQLCRDSLSSTERLAVLRRCRDLTDGASGAEPEETTMLRKLSLVAVAAASLAAAALAPTSASAFGGHGGWHGGWHGGRGWGGPRFFVGGPAYYGYNYGYGGCYVRQLVPTPWGPRWRLVNRCY